MKTVKSSKLGKENLLTLKEPLFIEHNCKIVGYYYPVINHQEVKKAKEELDLIMEKVLAETELTEEEYVSCVIFYNAVVLMYLLLFFCYPDLSSGYDLNDIEKLLNDEDLNFEDEDEFEDFDFDDLDNLK